MARRRGGVARAGNISRAENERTRLAAANARLRFFSFLSERFESLRQQLALAGCRLVRLYCFIHSDFFNSVITYIFIFMKVFFFFYSPRHLVLLE